MNPNSLKSGLDYMHRGYGWYRDVGKASWRTRKLVDWSTLSEDRSVDPVDEPALLQSFKAAWEEPNDKSLPPEWSRHVKVTDAFIHASNPTVIYRYPLPTQNTSSATMSDKNTPLLSCMTRTTLLRIRRVLVPCDILDTADLMRSGAMAAMMYQTSVFETGLYNFKPPQLHSLCPVITLEDGKGRWAGAMTIMENEASVQPGSELKMIAISTGSALQSDVAASYPEGIDSQGYWCYGHLLEDYHFRPLDWRGSPDNRGGSGKFSAFKDTQQSLDAGIDVGPFPFHYFPSLRNKSRAVEPTAPSGSNQPERYHFYNVLWVETIEGVMYRKAAGRVPKEVWELNCGEPTEIVLG